MTPATKLWKASLAELGEVTSDPLRAAFVARAVAALAEMAHRLGPAELAEATASASNAAVLLRGMMQPSAAGLFVEHDPLAKAHARGLERRDALLASEGGVLTADAVAKRLRISRQAVNKRRDLRQLLAVQIGRRGYLYPAWQFSETGTLDGFPEVLAALGDTPGFGAMRFFLAGADRLGGRRPLDALRKGDLSGALRAAKTFGEHGAV